MFFLPVCAWGPTANGGNDENRNFSNDGGVFRNTSGTGAQWQLYSIDAKTGAERMLAALNLPAATDRIAGFSLHPDGKRFLTSAAKWPY